METSNNNIGPVDTERHIMVRVEEDPINVKRKIFKRFPWFLFSWTIVLIFVYVYVDNSNYAYGCKSDMFEWRLTTYHMFHIDIQHLVFNILAFWLFGLYIHMVYNDFVNIPIYVIGVIISGFTYYIDCDLQGSNKKIIGASGGVCAIVGAVFVTAVWRFGKGIYEVGQEYSINDRIKYSMVKYTLSFTTIFSVLGMVSYDLVMYLIQGTENISHIAHFGGYITGVFVGIIIITIDTRMFKK
jgi:membrane associated rhomboid family serine protease